MINPVIFTIELFGYEFPIYWYGVLVTFGAIVGAWIAEKEISRRGENGQAIWDAFLWVLPAGIVGARIWFILNATLGGNRIYIENPIQVFNVRGGGLHIFGGFLFGTLTLFWYLRKNKMDAWLFLDAIAPSVLIGQAVARPANFINQELYGPPTSLIWGIPIEAVKRIGPYNNLSLYPVSTTRFHPTFAYEMILNFVIAVFLLWLARNYIKSLKPGSIFCGWLVLAGFSRALIELFRTDQPHIPGTYISYTTFVALSMSVSGLLLLLIRHSKIKASLFVNWEDQYSIASQNHTAETKLPVAKLNDDK